MYPRLFEIPRNLRHRAADDLHVRRHAGGRLSRRACSSPSCAAARRGSTRDACSISASTSSSPRSSARSCCCCSSISTTSATTRMRFWCSRDRAACFTAASSRRRSSRSGTSAVTQLPFWTTCDMFAPGIALGHVIGRLGCLMAGCCYGPADRRAVGGHLHRSVCRRERRHAAERAAASRRRCTKPAPSC